MRVKTFDWYYSHRIYAFLTYERRERSPRRSAKPIAKQRNATAGIPYDYKARYFFSLREKTEMRVKTFDCYSSYQIHAHPHMNAGNGLRAVPQNLSQSRGMPRRAFPTITRKANFFSLREKTEMRVKTFDWYSSHRIYAYPTYERRERSPCRSGKLTRPRNATAGIPYDYKKGTSSPSGRRLR